MLGSASEVPPSRRRILSAQVFSKDSNKQKKFRKAGHDVLEGHRSGSSPASSTSSSPAQLLEPQRRRSLDSVQFGIPKVIGPFQPPKLPHLPSIFEDQKVFLQGSQMLEKLNRIIRSNSENFDNPESPSSNGDEDMCSHKLSKQNIRRVIFYYNKLKQLLEQRCILILKGECSDHIGRAQKFVQECKSFSLKEKIKAKTIPIKLRNPFIDSTDISIRNLNQLMDNLSTHTDLWPSLMRNFRRIICLFHVGFNVHLHHLLCKTNIVLRRLRHQAFYWVHYILDISLQQLCQSDSNIISPELLQSILDSCKTFNRLLIEKSKHDSSHLGVMTGSFSKHLSDVIEVPEISCSRILNYLSFLEAGSAAEKVVRFLTSEGQKEMKNISKDVSMKWIPDAFFQPHGQRDNSTSDYCSASASEIDNAVVQENLGKRVKIQVQPFDGAVSSTACLFGTILQRNQALVLKYLFAVTCLNNTSSDKMEITVQQEGKLHQNITLRPTWKVPLQRYTDRSCSFLEKVYWHNFWDQMEKHTVKLLTEVSHHQYGDMFAGTVVLWPETLKTAVINILKQSSEDEDLCPEVKSVIQNIYGNLFRIAAYTSWSDRFSLALVVTESHRCPAVPVSGGWACTKPGNLLCSSVEPLIGYLVITTVCNKHAHSVRALQQLLSTLDYFCMWSSIRKRSLLSSWDVSLYLLVSCSDTKHIINLLGHADHVKLQKHPTGKKCPPSHEAVLQLWSLLHQKVSEMKDSLEEVPSLVYQKAFKLSSEIIKAHMSRISIKSYFIKGSLKVRSPYVEELICTILVPVFDTLKCLPYQLSVITSVVSSVADAWLIVLRNRKRKVNVLDAQQFYQDVQQVIEWIEESDISVDDKKKLKREKSVLKLQHVAELLSTMDVQPTKCCIGNNRVMPVVTSDNRFSKRVNAGLTTSEQEEWRRLHVGYTPLILIIHVMNCDEQSQILAPTTYVPK